MNSLMDWDPFQDFFGVDPFRAVRSDLGQYLLPALELKETPTSFELKLDVPGVKEPDLDVNLSGNRLTITGKRDAEKKEENETWHSYERRYGAFTRVVTLPEDVATDKIAASLREGVLAISIPKLPEARPQKITVSAP
jgi:HSP20 family protein